MLKTLKADLQTVKTAAMLLDSLVTTTEIITPISELIIPVLAGPLIYLFVTTFNYATDFDSPVNVTGSISGIIKELLKKINNILPDMEKKLGIAEKLLSKQGEREAATEKYARAKLFSLNVKRQEEQQAAQQQAQNQQQQQQEQQAAQQQTENQQQAQPQQEQSNALPDEDPYSRTD